jgi:sarcosine oxidase subunit delta
MRITCPYCGFRDSQEFTCLGDAAPHRPDPTTADAATTFHDYVYLRDNSAGEKRELWYHTNGCRRWLEVTRNTLTHEIYSVNFPHKAGAGT